MLRSHALVSELSPQAQRAKRLRPLENAPDGALRVHEIYASVQGESSYAGRPCVFVRTTGCHLRCGYCDTPHAFTQGSWMQADTIEASVVAYGIPLVEFTGGEPLLQPGVAPLMARLCDLGHEVLVETSGSLPVDGLDHRIVRILDMKTPSSGEVGANDYANLKTIRAMDEVKFVVADRTDYLWARTLMQTYDLGERSTVLFGVVHDTLAPRLLAEWLVDDRLNARFQIQLHKVLWAPDARGV